MTNINNSGFTKSSRGSDTWTDNLAANDAPNPRAATSQDLGGAAPKTQFAEHLTAPTQKAGALARPTRPDSPIKPQAVQDNQTPTRQPLRPSPRSSKQEPTQAPWERPAPTARMADMDRPSKTIDMPMRGPTPSRGVDIPTRGQLPAAPKVTVDETPQAPMRAGPPAVAASTPSVVTNTGTVVPTEGTEEGLEDWRQKLQQMLASANPELLMQQSPALALLAGRLEFLEPAQIPAVVAQSPLLQSILSLPQTADVLQTAMPLEQNLQLLGLAPLPSQAKNAGPISLAGMEAQTPEPLVTVGETLKALGFDIRRIMQEGDLLKDNLGLDGLQTYMQRAERMQSSLGLPVQWPTMSAGAAAAAQGNPKATLDPALMAQLSRLDPKAPAPRETVQLWSQNPETAELMPLTVLDDGGSPLFFNPLEGANEAWDPFAAPTELPADPALAPTPDDLPLVMNTLPRAPTVTQDPFMAMSQRWNAATLQTLRPEDFASRDSSEIPMETKQAAAQPLRSLDDILSSQFIQAPDFMNRTDAAPTLPQDASAFDVNSLQISMQDPGSSSSDSGGDLSGRNQNSSFMNQDNSAIATPGAHTAASHKAFSVETPAAPQAPSAPVSHQQLQDILDKSSMLIKDGGGSIRLDLGSKEMGPLDLALDIKDKTVELRIVTHSDQARDALVQELPKLRESLQSQNLNLEKVEIGLSYNSAWSQSSGNGQQNREQFFENRSESSSRGPGGIRSTSRSYRQAFVSSPEARVPLHNGLIQVRV